MDSKAKDVAVRSSAAALGALVGGVAGGPGGAVAGAAAGPAFEPLMRRVWDELVPDSQASAAGVLEAASEHAGIDVEDLADAVLKDEQRRLLAGLALSSGSRTRNRAKIRALGRALAEGVLADDDAKLDQEQLIIRALDDMEAPHIAVLDLLVRFVPFGSEPRLYSEMDPTDSGAPKRRWVPYQLGAARPGLRDGVVSILGTLQRHGLAREDQNIRQTLEAYTRSIQRQQEHPDPPGMRPRSQALPGDFGAAYPEWVPTPLGERVLEYLRQEGAEVAPEHPQGEQ